MIFFKGLALIVGIFDVLHMGDIGVLDGYLNGDAILYAISIDGDTVK